LFHEKMVAGDLHRAGDALSWSERRVESPA
jgi:hypothetical protein